MDRLKANLAKTAADGARSETLIYAEIVSAQGELQLGHEEQPPLHGKAEHGHAQQRRHEGAASNDSVEGFLRIQAGISL